MITDDFGYWFSGIVDGEANFILGCRYQTSTPNALVRKVGLKIKVRGDDLPMLEYIERNIGGTVSRAESWYVQWMMQRAEDCARILIPIFDTYTLHSKKAQEYQVWRPLVLRHYELSLFPKRSTERLPFTPQLNADFEQAVVEIKNIRDYARQLEKGGDA